MSGPEGCLIVETKRPEQQGRAQGVKIRGSGYQVPGGRPGPLLASELAHSGPRCTEQEDRHDGQ
jgi:hypothetical protein